MAKIDFKNASLRNGQMIIPGARPNSAPAGFARVGGRPKAYPIADRDHGVHAKEALNRIPGTHLHQFDADAATVPIHSGMHFREGSKLNVGISRTMAKSPTDDEAFAAGFPRREDVPTVPGMRGEYMQTPGVNGLRNRLPDKVRK